MAIRYSMNPFLGNQSMGGELEEASETSGTAIGAAIKHGMDTGGFGKEGRGYRQYLKDFEATEDEMMPESFKEWSKEEATLPELKKKYAGSYKKWEDDKEEWINTDTSTDQWGEKFFTSLGGPAGIGGYLAEWLYDDEGAPPPPATFEEYLEGEGKDIKFEKEEKKAGVLQNLLKSWGL
jgi:hypothetical protein